VILFDELEKAHADVLNILLQVLDDGRITDAQGRVVNFEHTVIIMTSNAGSEQRSTSLGFDRSPNQQAKDKAMKALGELLRPEFINRVDEIICFNKLTEENFRGIADIMLQELKDSLQERGLSLSWSEGVVDYLVKKSFSETYGARNLRRTIQRDLEDPIAEKIIESFEKPITGVRLEADEDSVTVISES
jgi:ATP-dependent Clp protease ATP-binding subunit ClpA